jgi:enoyl-CoA hydratase/carnithine racemase
VSYVSCDIDDGIAVITMRRAERLNAMGHALLSELAAALTSFAQDPALRVAVLTGTGRGFCVGLDLKERPAESAGPMAIPDISPLVNPFWPVNTLTKPVVTAVNGYAFGGGFYLAVQGDMCLAAESASFEISEVHRGGLSGWEVGFLLSLPRAIRSEIALGGRISAQRGYDLGVLNEVVPDERLLEDALRRARQLTTVPPAVTRRNLELLRALAPVVPDEVQQRRDSYEREIAASQDAREAVAAFLAKRRPVWRDT